MSVSEQEAKQQIAQMQQSLESMRVSARRGSYVRIVGVIVGFAIVGIYVYLFIGLGMAVKNSKEFPKIIKNRLEVLQPQKVLATAAEKALPVLWEESQKMAADMDLRAIIQPELAALVQELQPLMTQEIDRVLPHVQTAVVREGNIAVQQLHSDLQGLLDARVQTLIRKHETQIAQETGLTQDKVEQILVNIIDANQEALLSVVQKRWGDNTTQLAHIANLVDELPVLPPLSEEELVKHTVYTLIALLKYKLPDYDLKVQIGRTPAPAQPAPGGARGPSPAELVNQLEAALKDPNLPEESSKAIRQELEKARKALQEQKSKAPAVTQPVSDAEILQRKIKALEEALKRTDLPAQARQGIQQELDKARKAQQ